MNRQCCIRGTQSGQGRTRGESNDSTASRETGFTLIELLIVAVILPVVVGAIAYALVAVFSLQGGATSRLTNSDDAQTVSATYESDVQSAAQITTMNGSQYQCGASGTQLLGLQWGTTPSTTVVVSYEEVGTSSPYSLVRNYCTGQSTIPTTVSSVSFNLPANQPPPTFSCAAWQANCAASTGWISAEGVSDVAFAINETGATANVGAFDYTLVATPGIYLDQISGPDGGGSPVYPFALLGQPTCTATGPATLNMTGGSKVVVETGSSPPVLLPLYVASTCPDAITIDPGQSISQVSNIITNDPNTSTPGSDSYCVLRGKKVTSCDPSQVGPTESAPPTSVVDPLASLTPPSNPTLPPSCLNQACPQGEEFSTAQTLTTSFGTTGDTYIFDQNVTLSSNATVNFAPGIYWFKGGLTMPSPGNARASFGTGTYLFGNATTDTCPNSTCLSTSNGDSITTDNTAGVLFYVETGAVSIAGDASVSISAAQSGNPLNALYGEVALWDAATSTLTVNNSGSTSDTFSGIYDPNGEVILSGSGAVDVSFVEANSASLSGSGSLTLGQ
ncbi:MAG: hypothetical protein JWM55_1721 [Acidimicrobiaceae bacterium]|nr:hypothetical protein [Acidimicrobiaceae bacterium]